MPRCALDVPCALDLTLFVRYLTCVHLLCIAVDAYKKMLARRNPETGRMETNGLSTTLAGAAAGVTSTITCFPLEVLRTRLACSSQYRSLVHAAVDIARTEGPKAFFGGLGPSLAGVIPYAGANLGMYDGMRWAYTRATGEERVPKTAALVIGAVAGVSAATFTFPLEVVRRRMMMGAKYANTAVALRSVRARASWRSRLAFARADASALFITLLQIAAAEGTGALFKGCVLNWAKLAPSGAFLVLSIWPVVLSALC